MGVILEVGLIVYFVCASVVGVYSTPLLRRWLLPTLHDTPMTKVKGHPYYNHSFIALL